MRRVTPENPSVFIKARSRGKGPRDLEICQVDNYFKTKNIEKGGIDMAIVRWGSNPDEVSDFDRLRREVNQLFNVFGPGTEPFVSRVYPALNLTDDGNNFHVRAELPGVDPESLDISVVEGQLLIRGKKRLNRRNRRRGIIAGSGNRVFSEGRWRCLLRSIRERSLLI